MHIWSVVAIIAIILIAGIFVGLSIFNIDKTSGLISSKQLIPFAQRIGNTTSSNNTGNLNLSCPAGTSINVIGAYYQVIDPYNECTLNPMAPIEAACDSSKGAGKCSTTGDCTDAAYYCNNGTCMLNPNQTATGCQGIIDSYIANGLQAPNYIFKPSGNPPVNGQPAGYCMDNVVCYGGGQTYTPPSQVPITFPIASNMMCGTQCSVRNISAYIAQKCQGQQNCSLTESDFGPYPCAIAPSATNVTGATDVLNARNATVPDQYYELPFTYGSNGSPAIPSDDLVGGSANLSTTSANIGYNVHGIYACT